MSALGMAVSPVFTRGLVSTDLAVRFPSSASQSLIWLPFDAGTYADASVADDLTTWTKRNCSFTAHTDPGGGSDAVAIQDTADASPTRHDIYEGAVTPADATAHLEFWAKPLTYDWVNAVLGSGSNLHVNVRTATAGSGTGTLTVLENHGAADWKKFRVSGAMASANLFLRAADSDGGELYTGAGDEAVALGTGSTYGPTFTQRRYSAVTDQGDDGHNITFAAAANQPLYGANALGSQHIGSFDGSDDSGVIAAGSGWPAHTSHSVFVLLNREALAANKTLLDAQTGRLTLLTSRAVDADLVSYYDGVYRDIALTDTGWMILEWHLDADATSCTIVQTSATSSTTLGSAAYTPRALGGTVTLGSSYTGSDNIDTQLGSFVIISRATGHAAGVTSAAEREAVRRNLRAYASAEGITL